MIFVLRFVPITDVRGDWISVAKFCPGLEILALFDSTSDGVNTIKFTPDTLALERVTLRFVGENSFPVSSGVIT